MKYNYCTMLIMFCALSMLGIIHYFPNAPNPSEYSRLYQIRALVEDKTLAIDAMITRYGHVMDKAAYNGHFYSDKAFGMTLLCLPVYSLYYTLFGPAPDNEWLKYLLRCVTVVIPALILIFIICQTYLLPDNKTAGCTIAGFLFGTIFFTYSTLLYSHTTTASCAGIAWCMIATLRKPVSAVRMATIGVLCGFCVILEYPAAILSAWLLLYAILVLIRHKWFSLTKCVVLLAAFCVPIVIQMLVNYLSFDNPFSTGYAHKVAVSQTYYHAEGLSGVAFPSWNTLWGILFSPARGLFYFSPFLLFSIPSLILSLKQKGWRRLEGCIIGGIIVSFTLFAASVVDWRAGWTVGARYYLPVLPFMLILLLKYPPIHGTHTSLRAGSTWVEITYIGLIIWSCIHCLALTITFPSVPEVFQVPLWDFAWPLIQRGYFTLMAPYLIGVPPWISALTMLIAIFGLLGFFCVQNKRYIQFGTALVLGLALTLSSAILPMDDSLEKHNKFSYLYRFMDKPVDVLGELYIMHNKASERIEIQYALAQQLKQLGCYTFSKKHLMQILTKTPSHKLARKDLIEIDAALKRDRPRYEQIINRLDSIGPENISENIKICLLFGDLRSVLLLKNSVSSVQSTSIRQLHTLITLLEENE